MLYLEPGLDVKGAVEGAEAAHAQGLRGQGPDDDGGIPRKLSSGAMKDKRIKN